MAFLDMAVSLLIGCLAGLGVGSGGLLILYLTAADGMAQLPAQGLNLGVFSFALGAAVLVHLHRRSLSRGVLLIVVLFGAAGACLGSLLARGLDTAVLRTALGGLMLFMGAVALLPRKKH